MYTSVVASLYPSPTLNCFMILSYAALGVNWKPTNLSEFLMVSPHLKTSLLTSVSNYKCNLCELAYEGVKKNKIVFSQKELPSFKRYIITRRSPHTAWVYLSLSKGMARLVADRLYNFIHLAVQELLTAYYISKMESDRHAEVFESLLDVSCSSAALQFYSAFSQLTNEGVQNIITKHGFFGLGKDNQKPFLLSDARLSILNCFFEAQLCDESFYRQILGTSLTLLPPRP